MWVLLFLTYCVLLQETQKFRSELMRKLLKDKDTFGDDLDEVIDVCTEVLIFCFMCPNIQVIIVSGCLLYLPIDCFGVSNFLSINRCWPLISLQ